VAIGTWKGTGVKIWDARSGTVAADLPVDGSASVLYSPDGRWLLTGSSKEYVLWDVSRWVVARRFGREPAGGIPGEAAFREDGRVLAVARSRSLLQLIDPTTGRELASLEPSDPQLITSLAFCPDGRLLVARAGSDEVRAWDLQAVRRGLDSLGLDWEDPRPLGATLERPATVREMIEVVEAAWLEMFREGDRLSRAGRADAGAYLRSIECGAPGVVPWTRLARAHLSLGDHKNYIATCRELLKKLGVASPAPVTANDVARIFALGPSALEDYAPAIRMAQLAADGGESDGLSTLGAILYRAGRLSDAIEQLNRSVTAHRDGGTQFDAIFLAMAHHQLGHTEEARTWLKHASVTAPVPTRKPDTSGSTSWIPSVELGILRREAATLFELARG
jgi:hypothetical protein